jgi:1,4-alpha-glucan branching enzyme
MPRRPTANIPQSPEGQPIGALVTGPSQVTFRAWAPWVKTLAVEILGSQPEIVPMEPQPFGYWETRRRDSLPICFA